MSNFSSTGLTLVCAVLLVMAVAFAAIGGWLAFMPPSIDQAIVTVAGQPRPLGACVARVLGGDRRLAGRTVMARRHDALTLLDDPSNKTARVMFDGTMEVKFTVTLRADGPKRTQARITTIPQFNPVPIVDAAVRHCAGKK